MNLRSFWYVVCESRDLKRNRVLARKLMGERLAVFRGKDGRPAALRDLCMHRNAPLSGGAVKDGELQCPYHGWVYDCEGTVVCVPAEGTGFQATERRAAKRYATVEQDGFVFVRLEDGPDAPAAPFKMPRWGDKGWHHIRLLNRFGNNVTNCAENFIDVPHTAFVHTGVFRKTRNQKIEITVKRANGSVEIEYRGETSNLGWFSWFLNPKGEKFVHTDSFHMPNVTSVLYAFSSTRQLYITSHSVPVEEDDTLVYTDLTYNFGIWSRLARPILRFQGQWVIDQDVDILGKQMDSIKKHGEHFNNTTCDAIHVFVESIRSELAAGRDPRLLPEKSADITFWV